MGDVRVHLMHDPDRLGWRHDGPRFVLVAWGIATVAMVAMAAVVGIIVSVVATVLAALGGEQSGEQLGEIAKQAIDSRAFFWTALVASQVTLFPCAWLACRALRKSARERLGLVATNLGRVQGAVLLSATSVPFAVGLAAAWLVSSAIGSSSDVQFGLERMWYEGSRAESAAWILVIALLPGFVEEVFYRGFLQRGLLLRWGPAASIVTSSLLFAVVHGEAAAAAAMVPLGLWLGVVAWRTGSVVMTFAMHATLNGLWTAGMMVLHREPASEAMLDWIAVAVLVLGVVAFPWAIAILRRQPAVASSTSGPIAPVLRPLWLFSRVVGSALVVGSLALVLVPPEVAVPARAEVLERDWPTLGELEAGATETAVCTAMGEAGAVEFSLVPGIGTRVALPENRAGIDEVIVTLDDGGETVWLVYAGEHTGKGATGRPTGIVEQLASGDPTVLSMTLSQGEPPVSVRLTLEDDEASKVAAFERARAEGWALRGR